MKDHSLTALGWDEFFSSQLDKYLIAGCTVGRVTTENKTNYEVATGDGHFLAEPTGKLLFTSSLSDLPKVGDWVVVRRMDEGTAIIHHVFKRKATLSRKAAGKAFNEQLIAVNIDVVFIVQALDDDFSPARIERYLSAINGMKAVVVFNKADLCDDLINKVSAVTQRLSGVDVIAISAVNGEIDELSARIIPGKTYAFVGSSGVGKSSLINRLANGELMKTSSVREKDSKGRHTTTRRELIVLPGGGIVIDTPGMREFQPWSDENIGDVFPEIEAFASSCRFSDCQHTHEVDCAVKAAVEAGKLDRAKYEHYLRLRRELDYQESLVDAKKARERKSAIKQIMKAHNRMTRKKRKE